jgi:hypothetical protein
VKRLRKPFLEVCVCWLKKRGGERLCYKRGGMKCWRREGVEESLTRLKREGAILPLFEPLKEKF